MNEQVAVYRPFWFSAKRGDKLDRACGLQRICGNSRRSGALGHPRGTVLFAAPG